jgi:Fe-S-cluster containining protein
MMTKHQCMHAKTAQLQSIYDEFEREAAPYKEKAACKRGCAFCCTDAGSIHITTLEGLAIGSAMAQFTKSRKVAVQKALTKDMKRREKGQSSPCPFLMKNKACMIYTTRPFACRRVYSLETCRKEKPPILSRHVMDMGEKAINALQKLDDTGYSGHLSYVLYMLDAPEFFKTYRKGGFKPEAVRDFGKSHQIAINRMVSR